MSDKKLKKKVSFRVAAAAVFCLFAAMPVFAAVVSSSAVFGRTVTPGEFRLFGYSSVSDDGKTLMLDSSVAPGEFGWKRYAYAGRDWFLESEGIGRALLAPLYADFVRDIHRIQREKGYTDIKLLSVGLAGFDDVFTRRLHELGVWNCFSGFCLHPGRGNFTPDYPYLRPERAAGGAAATDGTAKAEQFSRSNFWNFLGAVRGAQKLIREQGDMPLWLTDRRIIAGQKRESERRHRWR